MRYFTRMHDESNTTEITAKEAKRYLESWYKKSDVKALFEDETAFRLHTPTRDIWTQTDDGMVPMPGFYGTVG